MMAQQDVSIATGFLSSIFGLGLSVILPPLFIPYILLGGYDPENLANLVDRIELLLQENPNSDGFWMELEYDTLFLMPVLLISFTTVDGSPVAGWWSDTGYLIDNIYFVALFLRQLQDFHDNYPDYNFNP